MTELTHLISQLEAGSTDLVRCLSTYPDLSRNDQLKLVLADQKYRVQRGEPFSADHYAQLIPWLTDEPSMLQQVIVHEFSLMLGSASSDELLAQFATRYSHLDRSLLYVLRARIVSSKRIAAPASDDPLTATQKFRSPHNPNDLTGTYISNQMVGDLRGGRYRFERKLGQGAYGEVYLALDTDLKRQVAIKVPSRKALEKLVDIDSYLVEAQTVAALDYPHIVTVYDVGRTLDGSIYVVSKFIDGCSLAQWIKNTPLDFEEIAKLLEQIAGALHHAHQRRLIHRDIKPANILIEESSGTPYVADFGLAIREEDYLQDGRIAGTPSYMSPEQIRGEGHRLDRRSDLFSLGVVMYWMLTGRLPFPGKTYTEVSHEITSLEPPAPRSLKEEIPVELERICIKLIRKRVSERYDNGRELAEDLRAWLLTRAVNPSKTITHSIVPRGLRSFNAEDAPFFLDLLPGTRSRDGLPVNLAFWKARIEQRDPDQTFTVGLLYGPSGCGKSSLIKAGLIPNLSPEVIAIYIEASSDDTPQRILRGLRKAIPELPKDLELVDVLKLLRRSNFKKVVVIIDQFEQWLHTNSNHADADLTNALRQCDGKNLQSILMIRDDFAMAIARFMDALDVPILQGANFATVDQFDIDHARTVLSKFGQAFGRIPSDEKEWSEEHKQFLDRVVAGLSHDGKVISVQVALFAEMVKDKPWVITTLEEVGGTEGIGVSFLEETFSSRSANPKHRLHQQAARQLLGNLLPEVGSDIKGHMRSYKSLLLESIYRDRTAEFDDLLKILDGQLRLITPTDPGGDTSDYSSQNTSLATRYYQLTHDYLVPSLRDWLTRKQRETKKGLAELKLAERAAAWSVNRESKQLPTLTEWFQIRRLTEPSKWKPNERSVMQQATSHHLYRIALTTVAVALLAWGGGFAWFEASRWQESTRIAGLVDTLIKAEPAQIPGIVKQLNANAKIAHVAEEFLIPQLKSDGKTPDEKRARLHARLACVANDPSLVELLIEELLTVKVNYVLPIRQLLRPSAAKWSGSLQSILQNEQADSLRRFRAALALADVVPASNEEIWSASHRSFVTQQLVSSNAEFQPMLRDALRPIQDKLLSELERIFGDSLASNAQRLSAANALADFASNNLPLLTHLLTVATPDQYEVIYPLVSAIPSPETIAQLSEVVAAMPSEDLGSVPRIAFGQRRANAAVTMLRLGEKEKVLSVFDWTDDPEAITQFIVRCHPRDIKIDSLLDLLDFTKHQQKGVNAGFISPRLANTARYALLLAIGEYAPTDIPPSRRETLIEQLADWYANDPNSGVHGAAGWLLRYLGQNEIADRIDQTPVPYSPEREWFTLAITVKPTPAPKPNSQKSEESETSEAMDRESDNEKPNSSNPADQTQPQSHPLEFLPPKSIYYTFIVHPSGDYTISSVEDEVDRIDVNEFRHTVKLTRPFAVLDREITFEELINFSPEYEDFMKQFNATPSDAGFGAHWYDSVAFCRWLGQEMGLAEIDQCYADPKTLDTEEYQSDPEEATFPRDWPMDLSKHGFRLPTESEWEVIARSGSRTAYGFGSDTALLDRFGWFTGNSGKKVHPGRQKRPNLRGLFDLHGNLFEWTHDWDGDFGNSRKKDPFGAKTGSGRVVRGGSWDFVAEICRSASRSNDAPTMRNGIFGFRLAFIPSAPTDSGSAN
jgi:serine/threonine protein kinase/formylglycine-generating enzyme required for sulfatase activity